MAGESVNPLLLMDHFSQNCQSKDYLEDICFKLMPGETQCVLGVQIPLLRTLIKSVEQPQSGYSGIYNVLGMPAEKALKKRGNRLMIMAQESTVIDMLSICENILIHEDTIQALSQAKRKAHCQMIMDETGIQLDINKSAFNLSSEEQKLIELLRIYAQQPEIAIFYETIPSLSTDAASRFSHVLDVLKKKGTGILYVTSRVEDAIALGDGISVLDNGHLRPLPDIESLRQNPYKVTRAIFGWETFPKSESEEKVAALKSILRAREAWTHESEMRRMLLYYTQDLEKAFNASSAMIYLLDEEQGSIVDYTSDRDEVKQCSKMRSECVLNLLKENAGMTVFHEKDIRRNRLFVQENEIKTVACYAVWMQHKQCALLQLAYTGYWTPDGQTEEYIDIFAREIKLAVENSRLLGQSTLLQESHHRIKNNLQMIANLLLLQQEDGSTAEGRRINEVIDSAIVRVKSIASVHNLLSGDSYGRSIVNLRRIIQEIANLYSQDQMEINIDVENISIPYNRATSIALLINELINNAVKYAYPKDAPRRRIDVSGHNLGTAVYLSVRDYGVGIKEGAPTNGSGLGMTIINSVVSGLNGTISYRSVNGFEALMEFPRSTLMPITQADDRF